MLYRLDGDLVLVCLIVGFTQDIVSTKDRVRRKVSAVELVARSVEVGSKFSRYNYSMVPAVVCYGLRLSINAVGSR